MILDIIYNSFKYITFGLTWYFLVKAFIGTFILRFNADDIAEFVKIVELDPKKHQFVGLILAMTSIDRFFVFIWAFFCCLSGYWLVLSLVVLVFLRVFKVINSFVENSLSLLLLSYMLYYYASIT